VFGRRDDERNPHQADRPQTSLSGPALRAIGRPVIPGKERNSG
jgi:hypothetical protein